MDQRFENVGNAGVLGSQWLVCYDSGYRCKAGDWRTHCRWKARMPFSSRFCFGSPQVGEQRLRIDSTHELADGSRLIHVPQGQIQIVVFQSPARRMRPPVSRLV